MENLMKLYEFSPTRSLRALWALRELGADFEFVPVNLVAGENRRPDLLRLNPAGKIPLLVDGGNRDFKRPFSPRGRVLVGS
jgi:glutathione S-transferase